MMAADVNQHKETQPIKNCYGPVQEKAALIGIPREQFDAQLLKQHDVMNN